MNELKLEKNQYLIHEDKIEKLEKKLATLETKCKKYGVEFNYKRVDELFTESDKKDEKGFPIVNHYFIVEASGLLKHADWEFVATIDHREGNGNVIRSYANSIQVPDRFYYSEPFCEHCNTKRRRKDTYIIHNTVTDEWKQVGRSCVNEFTNGLDAQWIAWYTQMYSEIEDSYSPDTSIRPREYHSVRTILLYAAECVKHFGYFKTDDRYPTKHRTLDYYYFCERGWVANKELREVYTEDMESVSFNINSDDTVKLVDDAISWVCNLSEKEITDNNYMHNLYNIVSNEYATCRDIGMLVSLIPTYNRELAKREREEQIRIENAKEVIASDFVGNIGDRITFKLESAECVCSRETMFGYQHLYKFKDVDGNILMWSTSNYIDSDKDINTICGTVKSHEEFRGVKQTFLTRCKLA